MWHGAANKAGYRDLANNCDGWHSDSLNKFGSATPLHNPRNQPSRSAHQHQNQQQQQPQPQPQKRRHKKRFAQNHTLGGRNSSTAASFGWPLFDPIEKFPCRMPLVVLCIETIGQPTSGLEAKRHQHSLENNWDSEI